MPGIGDFLLGLLLPGWYLEHLKAEVVECHDAERVSLYKGDKMGAKVWAQRAREAQWEVNRHLQQRWFEGRFGGFTRILHT